MIDKRKQHREYMKTYRIKNKDRFRIIKRKSYLKNKTKILESTRKYYAEHRRAMDDKKREYLLAHKEQRKETLYRYTHSDKGRLKIKLYNALRRTRSKISNMKIVQMVYEDNIKQYGTLTCYLCLSPISFGNDHLEHKLPLSRGGNTEYENLGVACIRCNLKKSNKTITEYKEYINDA